MKQLIKNLITIKNLIDIIEKILISGKYLTDSNYENLNKTLSHMKNNLIDSDSSTYFTLDSLIEVNIKKLAQLILL